MLNILQTGDLHLGKTLYEFSLEKDQKHLLSLLLQELSNQHYDALIIAGDIYDRSIPSQEAVRLFDDFLTAIKKDFPHLQVCIISGNHDSATRLSFASRFLESLNIHITANPEDCIKPILLPSKEKVEVALYQIPFLHVGSLRKEDGTFLKTQEELIGEAIQRITIAHTELQKTYKNIPAMLNTHLFTLAGQASDSERLFLGTAELISPTLFKPFCYTAIGHLHKKQKVTDRAYYAGSPLSYSFSEITDNKYFLHIELNTNEKKTMPSLDIKEIPITPLRKLVHIEASFEDFQKMTEHKDNFIEFIYTDTVILEDIAARLRKIFPYLLSVKQKARISAYQNGDIDFMQKKALFDKKEALPMKDIFTSFLQSIGEIKDTQVETDHSNKDVDNTAEWSDCIALFEQLAKEVQEEYNETT